MVDTIFATIAGGKIIMWTVPQILMALVACASPAIVVSDSSVVSQCRDGPP